MYCINAGFCATMVHINLTIIGNWQCGFIELLRLHSVIYAAYITRFINASDQKVIAGVLNTDN